MEHLIGRLYISLNGRPVASLTEEQLRDAGYPTKSRGQQLPLIAELAK